MWVVAPLNVIYSLKPDILTHLKSPTRPDGDNLSHLDPEIREIRDPVNGQCFIKSRLCVNSKHLSAFV